MVNRKYSYLRKNTILLTISSFGSKILTFLLVPMYTYILTTEDYGVADLITTSSYLLGGIFTINIADSVIRFAIERKEKQEEILAYGLSIMLKGGMLLGGILIIVWYFQIIEWIDYCYIFLFLHFFSAALNQILVNYLRAIDKIKEVAIAGIITTLVTILSNILLMVVFHLGLIGYLLSMVLGLLFSSVYCFMIICLGTRKIRFTQCDKETKNQMRAYSLPLVINGSAWWINNSLDKFFIIAFCGVAQNGIYAVAYKIPSILTIFQTIFSQAWSLSAIKEFDQNDEDNFFSNTYSIYNAGLVLICSILILMNEVIASVLFSKAFFEAWKYAPLLLIATLFSAMSGFVGTIFTAVKKSSIFSISTVGAAFINVILNWILIPRIGVLGAAIGTVCSFMAIWLIRLVCSRKYISWHIDFKRDFVVYILLFIQAILSGTESHNYLLQIITLFIVLYLYKHYIRRVISGVVKKFAK